MHKLQAGPSIIRLLWI